MSGFASYAANGTFEQEESHETPFDIVLRIVRRLHAEGCRNVYDWACQEVTEAGIFPGADRPELTNYDERVHNTVLAADRIVRSEKAVFYSPPSTRLTAYAYTGGKPGNDEVNIRRDCWNRARSSYYLTNALKKHGCGNGTALKPMPGQSCWWEGAR